MKNIFWALLMAVLMGTGLCGKASAAVECGLSLAENRQDRDLLNYKVTTNTDIARTPCIEPEKQVRSPVERSQGHDGWERVFYRNRIESQLFDLSRQIRELSDKAKAGGRGIPPELQTKIATLKDRETIVKERLMELRSSTSRATWFRVKAELDRALDDLKVVLDTSRFRLMGFGE